MGAENEDAAAFFMRFAMSGLLQHGAT